MMPLRLSKSPLIWAALLAGALMTATLVVITYNNELSQRHTIFKNDTTHVREAIGQQLRALAESLHGLKLLFDASSSVDADEFRLFAEDAVLRHQAIASVFYMPLVGAAERLQFEQTQRNQGLASYRIVNPIGHDHLSAGDRSRYFPITHFIPLTPESANRLGMDLLVANELRPYLEQAIDTARAVSIPPNATQALSSRLVIVEATYAGKNTPASLTERRASVNGMIAFEIDVTRLLDAVRMPPRFGLQISLQPPIHPEPSVLLQRATSCDHDTCLALAEFHDVAKLDMPHGQYSVSLSSFTALHDLSAGMLALAVLGGTLATGLLIALARATVLRGVDRERQHQQIRDEVDLRTHELALEKERAHITLAALGDAVISTDSTGRIGYLNPVAEQLIGYRNAEAVGHPIDALVRLTCERGGVVMDNPLLRCLTQAVVVASDEPCLLHGRQGEQSVVECVASPIRDRADVVSGAVLVLRNVSETHELTRMLAHQTDHDTLTGLPTRLVLVDSLRHLLERQRPHAKRIIAVLFLDLDRFKLINDNMGHHIGDKLLQEVAARLRTALRHDDIVSRIGGDEFIVVLNDLAHRADVEIITRKLVDTIARPILVDGHEFHTSASVGISIYPDNSLDSTVLMQQADTAMYRAKTEGRNKYVFFSEHMEADGKRRLLLENELRKALDAGGLELHYQPKVDSHSGAIYGAEALLRWTHPELGRLSPLEFIPIAEDSGLILPVSRWVLEEATAQMRRWLDAELPPISVSVNIADRQFHDNSLKSDVARVLQTHGIDPQSLELELTETILARDSGAAIDMLYELKQMGVTLSIDDFGTGYSSLGYLKRFPVDTLKIDRAFVKDIPADTDDTAICKAVVRLAHSLNLTVVAEGVETIEQLQLLREQGCNYIQGYYFSPPVPADQFAALLARNTTAA